MYSGDSPTTSDLHDEHPPLYSLQPAKPDIQDPPLSGDGTPPEENESMMMEYDSILDVREKGEGEYDNMLEVRGKEAEGEEGELAMEEGEKDDFTGVEREETVEMEEEGGRKHMEGDEGEGPSTAPSKGHKPRLTKALFIPHNGAKNEGYDIERMIRTFWPMQKKRVEKMSVKFLREASRNQVLPLARVKKIMKIDENVQKQMIAADAPLLLSVASEMFIEELTLRAWEVTEEAKRKTLQKIDVATASTRHDHMDFLIDIVQRKDVLPPPKKNQNHHHIIHPQHNVVQVMREAMDANGTKYIIKGNHAVLAESGGSSPPQEFSARLETGEEAQVIQIGKPIPLTSQAMSQLGLVPPSSSSSHPSYPSSSSAATIRLPASLLNGDHPAYRSLKIAKTPRGRPGGDHLKTSSPSTSQPVHSLPPRLVEESQ